MISVHPGVVRPGGFTLLEMSIVLMIMAVMAGACVYNFDSLSAEETLRKPAVELQGMTMEAMRRSVVFETPQAVVFDEKGFSMHFRQLTDARGAGENDPTWQRRVECPVGMKVSLKRFGASSFTPAAGQRFAIAPGSLCEPMTARFEFGSSWLQITLDPLSGATGDEEMYIAPAS